MLIIKAKLSHQIPVTLQIYQLQLRMFKPFKSINHHLPQHQIIQHNYNCKFQIIKAVVVGRSRTPSPSPSMEDNKEPPKKTDKHNHTPTMEKEQEKEKKEKELAPPSPPEKPEPGDCCGSGCVRCVWDVYYDQLDAYNQLLAQFNKPSN